MTVRIITAGNKLYSFTNVTVELLQSNPSLITIREEDKTLHNFVLANVTYYCVEPDDKTTGNTVIRQHVEEQFNRYMLFTNSAKAVTNVYQETRCGDGNFQTGKCGGE